ncbi:PREDICTED: X-ray repair cross-complementing protein 5-like [Acropora digitifera]|uniref:X-ray repair cross-complementing protein 5-like n=1 Tax=Acropora digitifera TaxID=70779 RepID=UPI00077B021A|nr:PREDICTED: X-ray repair cross-complementing protein 5-like [Acropora digitifera]
MILNINELSISSAVGRPSFAKAITTELMTLHEIWYQTGCCCYYSGCGTIHVSGFPRTRHVIGDFSQGHQHDHTEEGTCNRLNDSEGGYENITVARHLGLPDLEMLQFVHSQITPGSVETDFIDAIVVGMDLLREESKGKCEKKVYLFSDLGSPFGNDQLDTITEGFKSLEIQLTLIGPDLYGGDTSDEDDNAASGSSTSVVHRKEKTSQQIAGENCMRQMLESLDGETYSFSHVLPMLSFFQTRSIKQTTVFRGPLEIGSQLKINVYGYNKVREEKLASWKKLSAVSQASSNPDTMEVQMQRSYHLNDDDDTEVEKENVAQGYRYGKTLVPLTKIDKDSMKLPTERCLSVLCFASNDNVLRYQYIGENVIAFVPQPGDQHAALALSAFINAMYELNTVAIVRYCRAKNAAPKLGFLSPHIKQDYECLMFTALPFSEDIRQFGFASFDANKKWIPSEEQQDAVDSLITSMDLTNAQRDEDGQPIEALKCKTTFNPVRQRVFQCIQHRALNPDDHSLPDLDPVIASYLEPSAEFKARCTPQCTKVKDMFRLEKVEGKKKDIAAENIFGKIENSNKNGKVPRSSENRDETDFSMASLARGEVTQVGTVDPVRDFHVIISKKDEDRFDEAAKQMKERILQLVLDSFRDQFYPKALDCVKTLREEALKAGESMMFNTFIQETKERLINQRGHEFWLLMVKENVKMITEAEATDSTVTETQAKEFLECGSSKKEEVPVDEDMEDADDLLEMME